MDRSVKRFVAVFLLVVTIYGSFVYGRTLGSMRHRSSQVWRVLSANAGGGALGGLRLAQGRDANVPPEQVLEEVLDKVQREYVDASGGSNLKLSNGALSRMLASFNDPKTSYLEPSLFQAKRDALLGKYCGIGAILAVTKSKKQDVDYRHLTIVSVAPGSPAEQAGLQTGDRITEIDKRWIIAYPPRVDTEPLVKKVNEGKLTPEQEQQLNKDFEKIIEKFNKGLTLSKALPLLISGENKKLALTVERSGQAAPIAVELTTACTSVRPVEARIEGNKIGYLRVRFFNPSVVEATRAALSSLKGVRGLIVDLRSNAGGVRADKQTGVDGYDAALKLIAALTKGGRVATIERRPGQKEPLMVKAGAPALSVPMVVLVDRGTANLSELVAAALRDVGKARLIGGRTFGDPIVQLLAAISNGGGVEMANAHLFTVAGADLSGGLQPDIPVAPSASGGDPVLQRALTTLGA